MIAIPLAETSPSVPTPRSDRCGAVRDMLQQAIPLRPVEGAAPSVDRSTSVPDRHHENPAERPGAIVVDDKYTTTIALREGMILEQRAAARLTGLIYDVMTGRLHSADAPQWRVAVDGNLVRRRP